MERSHKVVPGSEFKAIPDKSEKGGGGEKMNCDGFDF